MLDVPADQLPFRVEYDVKAGEIVVWMTYGSGPKQTTRRKAIGSLEALAIQVASYRYEVFLQNRLAHTLAQAAVAHLGADPARLEAACPGAVGPDEYRAARDAAARNIARSGRSADSGRLTPCGDTKSCPSRVSPLLDGQASPSPEIRSFDAPEVEMTVDVMPVFRAKEGVSPRPARGAGEDLLQTSPYLTHVAPGADPPVVYLTDTFGPAFPEGDVPSADVVFGIVGLDRRIVWQDDHQVLAMLRAAASEPQAEAGLAARFGADRVAAAVARGWLQAPADLCRDYRLVSGEIEVTAHCNWGCPFCPVATDPKPRRTMPMHLFEEIITKLKAVGTIDYVTFQFFNEPTLDKHFTDRLKVLAEHGMQLALYSNASALTQGKIDALKQHGVLRHLIVNLPSVDEREFAELTGSRSYAHTTANVQAAIDAGLRVQIVVNGVGERLARNLDGVTHRYQPLGVEVFPSLTCDRAGDIGGAYAQGVRVEGRLTGCGWPVQHANISVTGDLFLCCNDYYQREVFGNIRDGSIDELMTSDAAVSLRQRVFGVADAADDFLCRRCHNQQPDFPGRDFRPIATFG